MVQVPCGESSTFSDNHDLILKSSRGLIRGSVEVVEGETFTATCIANMNNKVQAPVSLEWMPDKDQMKNPRISQKRKGNFSVVFTISRLNRSDAGVYKCVMLMADNEAKEKQLVLHVKPEGLWHLTYISWKGT